MQGDNKAPRLPLPYQVRVPLPFAPYLCLGTQGIVQDGACLPVPDPRVLGGLHGAGAGRGTGENEHVSSGNWKYVKNPLRDQAEGPESQGTNQTTRGLQAGAWHAERLPLNETRWLHYSHHGS